MSRLLAAMALAASLAMPLASAPASAGTVSRTSDPSPDDPLREARIADRQRTAELNAAQARHVAARDRGKANAPRTATGGAQAQYRAAQAKYRADMAAWRRRVAACQGGDWSQCDR